MNFTFNPNVIGQVLESLGGGELRRESARSQAIKNEMMLQDLNAQTRANAAQSSRLDEGLRLGGFSNDQINQAKQYYRGGVGEAPAFSTEQMSKIANALQEDTDLQGYGVSGARALNQMSQEKALFPYQLQEIKNNTGVNTSIAQALQGGDYQRASLLQNKPILQMTRDGQTFNTITGERTGEIDESARLANDMMKMKLESEKIDQDLARARIDAMNNKEAVAGRLSGGAGVKDFSQDEIGKLYTVTQTDPITGKQSLLFDRERYAQDSYEAMNKGVSLKELWYSKQGQNQSALSEERRAQMINDNISSLQGKSLDDIEQMLSAKIEQGELGLQDAVGIYRYFLK